MPPMATDPAAEPHRTATPALVVSAPAEEPPETEAVTLVQPYQARKHYTCPGCHGTIERGEGHLVVVPEHAPDLRRHWHRACWHRERRRRNGRSR
jgi:hypothetical protein